jgi:predicted AAA+ superfamily ATPase
MRYVIIQILKRMSASGGYANLILSNEFGGGKTHTLLLVYHILTNKERGFEYIRKYGIDRELDITDIPRIDVVSIDCRTLSSKITLWGKIADGLNMYDKIRKYDKERIQPGVDILTEILEKKPVLLLIDELYSYLKDAKSIPVGDSNLSELTVNFILNLMAAISTTKRSQLILSTTGEQPLYHEEDKEFSKRTEDAHGQAQRIDIKTWISHLSSRAS